MRNLKNQASPVRTIRFEPSVSEVVARKVIAQLGGTPPTQNETHVIAGGAEDEQSMSIYQATMICEGAEEADRATQLKAWQLLVDTGTAWKLQGFFGRNAAALIEAGLINAPRSRS